MPQNISHYFYYNYTSKILLCVVSPEFFVVHTRVLEFLRAKKLQCPVVKRLRYMNTMCKIEETANFTHAHSLSYDGEYITKSAVYGVSILYDEQNMCGYLKEKKFTGHLTPLLTSISHFHTSRDPLIATKHSHHHQEILIFSKKLLK